MPDELPSQASAGNDSNEPGGATPPETTQDTSTDSQSLTFANAGAILDQAGAEKRGRNALDEAESADPLADPDEKDPLAGDPAEEEEDAPESDDTETTPEDDDRPESPEDHDPALADADPGLPRRIRLDLERFNPRDAAILLHSRKTGKSLSEAEAELFGSAAPAASQSQVDAARPSHSAQIRREIDELKAQRRRSAEDFDVKRQLELTERIEASSEALGQALAQEGASASHREQAVDSSALRVGEAYPDAFVPGTELSDAIVAELDRSRIANPALLEQEDWPELLVGKIALRLGIAPKATGTHRPSAKKPAPRSPARPVASPAPGGRSAGRSSTSAEAIRAELADAIQRGDGQKADRIIRQLEGAA